MEKGAVLRLALAILACENGAEINTGGVQNIGKKEKDKENKLDERKGKDENGGVKNEKKGVVGIRGLRGFN